MTKKIAENRKWIIAILLSLLFHSLFFFCLPAFRHTEIKKNEIVVRLVEKSPLPAVQKNIYEVPKKNKKETLRTAAVKNTAKPVSAVQSKNETRKPQMKEAPEISAAPAAQVPDSAEQAENAVKTSTADENNDVNTGKTLHTEHKTSAMIASINSLVITKKVAPQYPAFSRKRIEEGTVTLLITIENGSVTDCRVESSSGYARLDEAAKRAVSQWKFAQTDSVRARVPISFKLSD